MKLVAVFTSILASGMFLSSSYISLLGQTLSEQQSSKMALPKEVRRLHLDDPINAVAWNTDGSRLAALSFEGGKITIWETKNWTILRSFFAGLGFPYAGNSLAFLADGTLLTAARGKGENGIRVNDIALTQWNVEAGKPIRDFPNTTESSSSFTGGRIDSFAYSQRDSIIAGVNYTGLFIFDSLSARVIRKIPFPLVQRDSGLPSNSARSTTSEDRAMSVAISPDGGSVAIGTLSGRVHFFNLQDGSLLHSFQAYPIGEYGVHEYGCASLSYNGDGSLIAVGKTPGFGGIRVITEQGEKFIYRKPSPISTTIWRAADGTLIKSLEGIAGDSLGGKDATTARALSWNTENVLAVGDSVALLLWDISESSQTKMLSLEIKGGVFSTAFSPHGLLAAVSGRDVLILR